MADAEKVALVERLLAEITMAARWIAELPGMEKQRLSELPTVLPEEVWREVARTSPARPCYEAAQRIEVYRKLAQLVDKAALERLRGEIRDRFGPVPAGVELLLQVAELKLLAAAGGVTIIESQEDKLLLTRHGELLTLGGKLPRLASREVKARLKELRKLLLALGGGPA